MLSTMAHDALILKRASPRSTFRWSDDVYDVLSDNEVVGTIIRVDDGALGGRPWMWSLGFSYLEGRSPTNGRAETCEDAMAAFAKSWRRG